MRVSSDPLPVLRRRRAVAGLIAGLIIFALIFTAGAGFYLFESKQSLLSSHALANRQAIQAQGEKEQLSLAVRIPPTGWLTTSVVNSGGVPSTITAVFVTSTSGGVLSNPQYLLGPGSGLSVTLPLSLSVGENTSSMSGCGGSAGCNIGINPTAFTYKTGTVLVNVLTQSGNVFSAPYPFTTGSTTSTVTSVVGAQTMTQTTGTTTVSTVNSGTTQILTTSSTIGSGLGAGTNSLELTLYGFCQTGTVACGPQGNAYQGGTIALQVTVTNLATVAMSVYINYLSEGTNGVKVTNPSCSGGVTSTQTVPALSTVIFPLCTFTANQGSSGGTVSFLGFAVGTYPVGSPTVTITSAETISNPVPVGNPASNIEGPWQLDYFTYNYCSYESCHSTTSNWQPAEILSASGNHQVVYQLRVTNSANNSLTILQQTFFIYANFNEQEMDFYVVNPITTWTSSLGAYACTNTGSGGSPTGSGCVQVAVGATQTLTFAACAPDSSYFMWANTGGGNGNCGSNDASFSPTEDELGFATIVYTYQNPTTHVWYTFAQTLPALDSYIKS